MWLKIEPAKDITMHVVPTKLISRCSSNSEANASELLEHLEEVFPRYCYEQVAVWRWPVSKVIFYFPNCSPGTDIFSLCC